MPFEIVRNDIVNMEVDAVVNTANPEPIIGSGVESAIYKKAGNDLLLARKKIGSIALGDVAITPGYGLDSKYVIHVVGPSWKDGKHGERKILATCYQKSLELAKEYNCESIAFPLLSTGNYGFPKTLALQIAVQEISNFLLENEMQVYLVVFGKEEFALSEKLFKSVNSYIDENYIHDKFFDEYGMDESDFDIREMLREPIFRSNAKTSVTLNIDEDEYDSYSYNEPSIVDIDNLGELLDDLDAGFSETLLKLIDRTGKKDSEIYKKANVDRKLFSKIRNNMDYKPSKTTALAFAFALELSLEETKDFIGRAGYALSHSNKFDVIIEYFLVEGYIHSYNNEQYQYNLAGLTPHEFYEYTMTHIYPCDDYYGVKATRLHTLEEIIDDKLNKKKQQADKARKQYQERSRVSQLLKKNPIELTISDQGILKRTIQKYANHKASIENEIDRLEHVLKEAQSAEQYLRSLTEEKLEYYRVPQHWQSDPHLQYIYGMSNLF